MLNQAEAIRAISSALDGHAPAAIIANGKPQRFPTCEKRGDDAGWYIAHDDDFPCVNFGDYRTGFKGFWSGRERRELSAVERERLDRVKREREAEQRQRQAAAIKRAVARWERAGAPDSEHTYLKRKAVRAHGLRQEGELLLVPVTDGAELVSLQTIGPDGDKRFEFDAPMSGGYFPLGEATDEIYIAEGYATAATIYENTGVLTICAFNAGNLLPVAQKIRALHPAARIVIAADDDFKTEGNPGVTKARKVAGAIGACVAIPPFDRDKGERGTDWNDWAAEHYLGEFHQAFSRAASGEAVKTDDELEIARERDAYNPPGEPARSAANRFALQPWTAIEFDEREEWLIKRLLPRHGLAAIYGKPGSFKSFVASHIALSIALAWPWARRRVTRAAVIYIAAEGAAGLRKRKAGFALAHPETPAEVPFYLVSVAPNLGSDPGDIPALVSAIEAAGVLPGCIVIDTLAQTLGAGDENGAGMTAFVANAGALASHFNALVLIVHHTGLGDDKRMRGHSSLNGALDAQILCERSEGEFAATLTLQKLKDDASDVRFRASLSRVVIGHDDDGDEISTLVVDAVEDVESAKVEKPKTIPRAQRLLMSVIVEAIDEDGEALRPYGASGPTVRAITEDKIRQRFFARIAEQAEPDEDKGKLFDRQRKGFKRSIEAALKDESLMAVEKSGRRLLWLP